MKFTKSIVVSSAAVILGFALIASAASYTFSNYLSVGSTGADVTALQNFLIANGFSIPSISSGAAQPGYFGSQTQAAVKAYQTQHGIPSTGFVGPLTVASLNKGGTAMTGTTGTVAMACPAGFTCTPVTPVTTTCPTGYTCTSATTPSTTVTSPSQITTPGIQGIMSVTQGPVSVSTAYAGQTMVPILDARIQAQYSDIAVQSIQVDLGSSTSAYNYDYSKIYLIDPTTNTVLTSEPLNSSTVVQSGNNYIVGLAGFNFVVPKGTFKDVQIAVDLYPTILTQYLGTLTTSIDTNGIRGVDGAGVNNYGPGSGSISQSIVVNQNQTLSATANLSLDSASPLTNAVGVTNTTAGTYLGLPVLIFDVNAQGDNLHLHSMTVNIGTTGSTGGAAVNAAYLYQGSTAIMSASVSGGVATFQNIPDGTVGATIPVNTSVPFTVKVDVTGPSNASFAENVIASVSAATVYNSADSSVSANGLGLAGNQQTVQGTGAVFSLSGTPSITKTAVNDQYGNATDTYTATFNVTAQAIGTAVNLGLPASTTNPMFAASSPYYATIYVNGVPVTSTSTLASLYTPVVAYSQPTNTTLSSNGTSFQLGINQSATIPVTFSFIVGKPGANVYALQLNGIGWNSSTGGNATSTFMSGQTAWRTSSI